MPCILNVTELTNELRLRVLALLLDGSVNHRNACRIASDELEVLAADLDATLEECADADDLVRDTAAEGLVTLAETRAEFLRVAEDLDLKDDQLGRQVAVRDLEDLAERLDATRVACPDLDPWIVDIRGTATPDEPRPERAVAAVTTTAARSQEPADDV